MCRSRRELSILIPTHIYLQNLASMQPRTSPVKFARPPVSRRSGRSPGREEAHEELQPVDDQEGPLDQDEDPEGSLVVADFDFELHADRDAVDADHLLSDLKK